MKYDNEQLNNIYDRTQGYCHLCHTKLCFSNYGKHKTKGGWHVEHSVPKHLGGTDHLNNLYAACIECNVLKGVKNTRTIRNRNGVTRAPYSRHKREGIKEGNTVGGMIAGGLAGSVFGPIGAIGGAIVGGLFGESLSPRK
jgi:hypothetical protein